MFAPRSPGRTRRCRRFQASSELFLHSTSTRTSTAWSPQSRSNSEHGRVVVQWLRSTAVEGRGRSLLHRLFSNTSSTRSSTISSSKSSPPPVIDLGSYSIDSTGREDDARRPSTLLGFIQMPKSLTTATAVRSFTSLFGLPCDLDVSPRRCPVLRGLPENGDARQPTVTRSPSRNRSGCRHGLGHVGWHDDLVAAGLGRSLRVNGTRLSFSDERPSDHRAFWVRSLQHRRTQRDV